MATSKRGLWNKIGRYITIVTLACFFLPFFGVSCQGADVVTISGADMVGGCRPGGLITQAEDRGAGRNSAMKAELDVGHVPREPLAIAALALALIGAALAWVRSRRALLASLVVSVACLGALGGLYAKVNGDLKRDVDSELQKKQTSKVMNDVEIDAGSRFGLWLTALLLVGVVAWTGMALREPEPPA